MPNNLHIYVTILHVHMVHRVGSEKKVDSAPNEWLKKRQTNGQEMKSKTTEKEKQ